MTRPQTYSLAHLRRQREAHARSDGYGRHRHIYLHDAMRRLVARFGARSWLDYGCGKGGFIEQIRPLDLVETIAGYDPAVSQFQQRPEGRFDLVTCLHVLDVVEPKFVGSVLDDIAALTGTIAMFDVLTMPKIASHLRPHPPFYWTGLIRSHMDVVDTTVEYPGLQDFERVIIMASPRSSS